MPLAAIDDDFVRSRDRRPGRGDRARSAAGLFEVRIALAAATVGRRSPASSSTCCSATRSMHEDVVLHDVELPDELARGVRRAAPWTARAAPARRARDARALTCSALKPQGLPAGAARGAGARGSRAAASTTSRTITGSPTRPIRRSRRASRRSRRRCARSSGRRAPRAMCRACRAISTRMRRQIAARRGRRHRHRDGRADDRGLVEFSRGWCGRTPTSPSSRIPTHGRRRAHRSAAPPRQAVPPARCRRGGVPQPWRTLRLLAGDLPRARARRRLRTGDGLRPCVPVPAGGMTTDRVPEMLDFYGADIMLLIGGALLEARERLVEATAAFVAEVHRISRMSMRATTSRDRSIHRKAKRRLPLGRRRASFPTRRTTARCSSRSPGRCCSPIRRCTGSCAISRSRPAASPRWSGTSTCTPC